MTHSLSAFDHPHVEILGDEDGIEGEPALYIRLDENVSIMGTVPEVRRWVDELQARVQLA